MKGLTKKCLLMVLVFCAETSHTCAETQTNENTTTERVDAKERPNVILVMTDDQGWGDVSYNGLTKIGTPNLDDMAGVGMRFNRFYAQPSCSPARACVLTGRHPHRQGVFWPGQRLRVQETNLAQAMKRAGYNTSHFGKWHLNGVSGPGKIVSNDDPLSPLKVGFDESFSVSNYFELDWTFGHNGEPVKRKGDGSEVIVAEALKYIDKMVKEETPFFTLIWFGSPHIPCRPLAKDLEAAGGSGYYGEIIAMDRSIGTLRAGLRKLGVAENTIVWFSSDNGGFVGNKDPNARGTNGPLRSQKAEIWEGGIRVPAIIEWPAKITKPVITDMPAGLVDVYPTLVDLLNIDVPNQIKPLDGLSLIPLMEGKMSKRPKPMGFIRVHNGPAAWSDNRYKLISPKKGVWELYDLTKDISESNDLASQHPEVVSRMKAELLKWLSSVENSYEGKDYPKREVVQPPKPNSKKKKK
jgi:arylsulfatase A-like enzyme